MASAKQDAKYWEEATQEAIVQLERIREVIAGDSLSPSRIALEQERFRLTAERLYLAKLGRAREIPVPTPVVDSQAKALAVQQDVARTLPPHKDYLRPWRTWFLGWGPLRPLLLSYAFMLGLGVAAVVGTMFLIVATVRRIRTAIA